MDRYLDAVVDDAMYPVYESTPEETVKWLRARPDMREQAYRVYLGRTGITVTVDAYLNAAEEREKAGKCTCTCTCGVGKK